MCKPTAKLGALGAIRDAHTDSVDGPRLLAANPLSRAWARTGRG